MAGERVHVRFASKASQRGYTVAQNVVLFDARLSGLARLLYVQLSHYAWRNPDVGPTQEQIAANIGRTDRQVRTFLAELEARWLLERKQRGLGRAVEYVLYEPAPDYLEREAKPAKGAVDNPVDAVEENESSPEADFRARPEAEFRPARKLAAGPVYMEGSEDVDVQEIRGVAGGRQRANTRDEHQAVADEAERSLRRSEFERRTA